MSNLAKLEDMNRFISLLMNLHQTALFNWNIEGTTYFMSQENMDKLIARYQSLKGQLSTKYGELL